MDSRAPFKLLRLNWKGLCGDRTVCLTWRAFHEKFREVCSDIIGAQNFHK